MSRLLPVARLYLVRPAGHFLLPWAIVGISFAANLVLWAAAGLGDLAGTFTGGLVSLYIGVFAVFVQAVTQLWPFTMGVGVSRRTFTAATLLVAGAEALVYGLLLAVLTAIENASDGWGVGLSFWAPASFDVGNAALQVLVSGVPFLACAGLGIAVGALFRRWGQYGAWGLALGLLLAVGLGLALAARLAGWADVWAWAGRQSVVTYTLVVPLVLAAGLAALGHATLRRTVP